MQFPPTMASTLRSSFFFHILLTFAAVDGYHIDCSDGSCMNNTLFCNESNDCNVVCTSYESTCDDVNIYCDSTTCSVFCEECKRANIYCGGSEGNSILYYDWEVHCAMNLRLWLRVRMSYSMQQRLLLSVCDHPFARRIAVQHHMFSRAVVSWHQHHCIWWNLSKYAMYRGQCMLSDESECFER